MPSELHEILLFLFRSRPVLAPKLLHDVLHVPLPRYHSLQIVESNLTNVQPPEYRADLVIVLHRGKRSVLGRERCPVCLLVFAASESLARWAAKPIAIGGGNTFTPFVIGPAGVPVVTDTARARADPQLAVLSAIAHGSQANSQLAAQVSPRALASTPSAPYCTLMWCCRT